MTNNTFNLYHARKLRYLRRNSEKKQIEIANVLNLSQQAYSKLESGAISFKDSTIDTLADFFNISPAEFENPTEGITIGSKNHNAGSNIYSVDFKILENLQKSIEQNLALTKLLIDTKDELIIAKDELIKILKVQRSI